MINVLILNTLVSENNISNGFTKYLSTTLMNKFRNNILYNFSDLKL